MEKFPDEEFHRVIDIIREFADNEYLDIIKQKAECLKSKNARHLVYLDRNNTADVWDSITKTIKSTSKATSAVIALMPSMGDFDHLSTYKI